MLIQAAANKWDISPTECRAEKGKILHVSLKWKPFLTVLAKLKFLPVTSWQLSVMHKDYFYENKILFSTGYRYKNNPIGALKSMVDYYHNMII